MTVRPRPPSLRNALVLVDTSALVALANGNDDNHEYAKQVWERIKAERCQPFTTNVLVIETYTLLLVRSHHIVARSWLKAQPFPEEWITEQDYKRARQLVLKYKDKDFSLADATSFVLMERLHTRWAFSFDEHFTQYGFPRLSV